MAQILNLIQKYRFVAVAGAVALLFGAKTLISVDEIVLSQMPQNLSAGEIAVVNVEAKANQELKLVLLDPLQNKTTVKGETDEDGFARIELAKEATGKAGEYKVTVSYNNKKIGKTEGKFEVTAGTASLINSSVAFSQSSLQNGQTALMSVILQDEFANPVKGHTLLVTPNKDEVQVYTSEFVTNQDGQMNFSITGSGNGIVNFNIFDSTEGKTILGSPALALNGTLNGTKNIQTNDFVTLASTGSVESFVIEGLDAKTLIGDTKTITVKAVDSAGFTVTDYTGTVRFSSTDSTATLPNDYTFLAEDQGEHSFSLAVKFVTPEEQTLTVTDLDDTSIGGEATTEVVQTIDSGTDFNSDFETVDFNRDGDFELVSPASGTYSSNSVEVQGEAEYGYTAVIYLNDEETGRTEIAFDNSFTYTLQDLKDGTYALYVEIAELDSSDEIANVIETSSTEKIVIDTTAPEIIDIKSDTPKLTPNAETIITLLSEKDLESVSVIFEGESYVMEETETSGKYQTKLVMPQTVGDYSLNVLMKDALGNEAEYRDALKLTVAEEEAVTPVSNTETDTNVTPTISKVTGLTATGDAEKVILSWEAPDSTNAIAFYRVYYGPSKDALFAISETFDSSTTWMITELTAGDTYYFAVTAVDVEGLEGDQSEPVSGIALAKDSAQNTSSQTPVYNSTKPTANVAGNVKRTPESGPASTALLVLSGLATLGYMAVRKRA